MRFNQRNMSNYKSLIMYIIVGACTTVVNFSTYYNLYSIFHFSNVVSVIIAWFISVAFAFITNKLFVFESKSFDRKFLLHEISTFFSCRLTTGFLEVAIMYILVDLLSYNAMFSKVINDVIVNILNYIASKIIVFRKYEKINSQC